MSTQKLVRVWDPLVRIFHWSLVASFFISYFSEDDFLSIHIVAGYVVLGLIVFRIVWGVVGTRYARFRNFVRSPQATMRYLKEIMAHQAKRYLGHNPAGGAMIVALLLSLLACTITGVAIYGAVEAAGPMSGLSGSIGEFGEDILKEVHEFFAHLSLLLVFLHVIGVAVASLQHKENLVRAMITGQKRDGSE